MTSMLRAAALATLAATFLSFASPGGVFADGRSDWSGYAWQQIRIAECSAASPVLQCPAYRQKWDWKRNQWVDIAITLDLARGELHLTQQLTNNDPHDDDHVCVTALAVDADGRNVMAHHQNWHMGPGQVIKRSFIYRSDLRRKVDTIHIGSRQCRDGAGQDDALYAQVLVGIQP